MYENYENRVKDFITEVKLKIYNINLKKKFFFIDD